jgi:hypothetical protein
MFAGFSPAANSRAAERAWRESLPDDCESAEEEINIERAAIDEVLRVLERQELPARAAAGA